MARFADLFRKKGEQVQVQCSFKRYIKKKKNNYLHGSRCQLASPGWGESSGRRKTVQTRQRVSSGTGNRCHHNKPTASNYWAYIRLKKSCLNLDHMQRSTCRFAGDIQNTRVVICTIMPSRTSLFTIMPSLFLILKCCATTPGTALIFSIWNRSICKYHVFAMTTILFKDSISTGAYGDKAKFLSIRTTDKTLKAPLIYYIQSSQFAQKPYC